MTTSASCLRSLSAFCRYRLYDLLEFSLWVAQKAHVITDYFVDEAYSDHPGYPRFARWEENESKLFKVGRLLIIIQP